MPRYLRSPLSLQESRNAIKSRIEQRNENFLRLAKRCIYEEIRSPYNRLLAWAGCEYGDLERMVGRNGIENTLGILRDKGVHVDAREFRSDCPIQRNGLSIETGSSDFHNPVLSGSGLEGKTSGTRSAGVSANFTWPLFREEAATEQLLLESHGLMDAPMAFWLPGPPGIAGIHNLMIHLSFGRPPSRWFSQVAPPAWTRAPVEACAAGFIKSCARMCGHKSPPIEYLPIDDAHKIIDWLLDSVASNGITMLKTYASSAVRLAAAAIHRGADMKGCTLLTGGEPLSRGRYEFLRKAGFDVFSRYAATETGMLGGACGCSEHHDEVHIYTDRIAVIPGRKAASPESEESEVLLITSLSQTTPRLLLNVSLGDCGSLDERECACLFGRLGMKLHLKNISNTEKSTAEGMTFSFSSLCNVIHTIISKSGGAPDDFQVWLSRSGEGVDRITIAIHPEVRGIESTSFISSLYSRMSQLPDGAGLAADLWKQGGTIRIVRDLPRRTKGQKFLPVMAHPSRRDENTVD